MYLIEINVLKNYSILQKVLKYFYSITLQHCIVYTYIHTYIYYIIIRVFDNVHKII